MAKFKVGDKVKITETSWADRTILNETATVLKVEDKSILVEFSRRIKGGHDGSGFADDACPIGKNGYCWAFYSKSGDRFEKVGGLKQLEFTF